jgi:hypothetical protein
VIALTSCSTELIGVLAFIETAVIAYTCYGSPPAQRDTAAPASYAENRVPGLGTADRLYAAVAISTLGRG